MTYEMNFFEESGMGEFALTSSTLSLTAISFTVVF